MVVICRGASRRARTEDVRTGFQSTDKTGVDLVQVIVRDNNVDQALRALKKKMQREGIFREMKMRRHYEKPSEKRAREDENVIGPDPEDDKDGHGLQHAKEFDA